jgi:VanZ family protein
MLGFDFAHGAAYACLMFWFAQLYEGRDGRVTCAAALVAMGVALEIAQGWTGYRGFSYADMRDDAIGVAIGALVAFTALARVLPGIDAALAASLGRAP